MILVAGSTGSLGSSVVRGLLASHVAVAALVRDAATDQARELKSSGARLAVGDLKSRATLEAALKDIETVVCTVSATMSRREGDSLESVDHQGVRNLIDAAAAAQAKRFVYVSFSRNIASDFPLAAAKRAAEKQLESSRLDYTLLLPSYFAETWFSPAVGFDVRAGTIRVYGDGEGRVSYVARDDVGKAAVACCLEPQRVSRQAIPIGGPKAISQLDAVALAEKVTGRKMLIEFMSAGHIAAARKAATDPLTATFLGLFAALAAGDEIPREWAATLGIRPQSMDEWFSRNFR